MQTQMASDIFQHFRAPIWTLLVLAPVIAEVLSGSTRLSFLFVLIPEIMVWGGGALLCRELVRRWRAGAVSLLLLGLALSIAEEFIIQQTSIAPLPFIGANATFGRYLGVNWIYFLFMLGYESVWVVLVPVQVTDLCFPVHRNQPWLRTRGIIATCIAFVIGSVMAWYGWTQQARKRLGAAPYQPPMLTVALGLAAIALLILLAYLLRETAQSGRVASRKTPSPWLIGAVVFLLSSAWWSLMVLIFAPQVAIPASLAFAAAVLWGILAFVLTRYLSSGGGWSDMHRWATIFAATLACMLPGYLSLTGWTQPDLIFKILINIAAVLAFLLLARRIHLRSEISPQNVGRHQMN